ncbi:PPC domain-containing protein [Avibacterium avium]|uniref:PPC domain-containing protein n=1 Tax=Avibacterium avium TaxID=751 RepID=UPI003BF780D6
MKKTNLFLTTLFASATVLLAGCSDPKPTTSAKAQVPATEQTAEQKAPSVVEKSTQSSGFVQHVKGKITGYDFDSYKFPGKKGEVLTLTLDTKGDAEAFLFGYDDYSYGESFTLPETTEYEVRVAQPRNSARKDKSAEYDLTIEVK